MLNVMCREGTVPKSQQRQNNGSRSEGDLGNQMHFNLSSATCCVTLGKSLPLSPPRFPHLKVRDNNGAKVQGCCED